MNDIALVLALILVGAELGAAVAHVLGQPRVVGQIAAGLILGPSLLGVVQNSPTITALSDLGALAILASAGLETNIRALKSVGFVALYAAFGGVILPFAGGAALAAAAGFDVRAALFCGAILTATSVGITAAVLHEMNLLSGRAGTAILGAAVIDDILGLMILGLVVADTTVGNSPVAALVPMVATLVIAALALRWLPNHLSTIVERLHLRGGGLAATLGFVLAVGWAFQTLGGLAAITGAYVAGLALAGSPLAKELQHGIGRVGEALLVPVFFVTIGLSADLRTVGPVLPFALALLGVAIFGKIIGSGLGALAGGLQKGAAGLVGIGMVARGEVALVAASLGLKSGAINSSLYAAVILVALGTTIVTPIGLNLWAKRPSIPLLSDVAADPSIALASGNDAERSPARS
ncbi:MAG TPA: cation:proton antiporter [Candidatus Limnocylindrales bacterium]